MSLSYESTGSGAAVAQIQTPPLKVPTIVIAPLETEFPVAIQVVELGQVILVDDTCSSSVIFTISEVVVMGICGAQDHTPPLKVPILATSLSELSIPTAIQVVELGQLTLSRRLAPDGSEVI
jgi:hypothetical protein